MKNNGVCAQQERELPCSSLFCAGFFTNKKPAESYDPAGSFGGKMGIRTPERF